MKGTKPAERWIITYNYGMSRGFYVGQTLTRRNAINEHCDHLGLTWRQCRRNGDRAVKALIVPLDKK